MSVDLPLKQIIEAALLATNEPLNIKQLQSLFVELNIESTISITQIRAALNELVEDYNERSIELKEVANGFRIQIRQNYAHWIAKLFQERSNRYSKALLEILAIIAYRQPVTRADIELIRGIEVNSSIIKTLLERGWIRIIGRKNVPGHPEMLATTHEFLDYFGLRSLDELPFN
jgi:segregation and condensation protein B